MDRWRRVRRCGFLVLTLAAVACSPDPGTPGDAHTVADVIVGLDTTPESGTPDDAMPNVVNQDVPVDRGAAPDTGCTTDEDGDGALAMSCGGTDCDDHDAHRFRGNAEVCDTAGHDEDCDPCTVASATTRDGDADMDTFLAAQCTNAFTGEAPRCDPMIVTVDEAARQVRGRDCNDDRTRGGADVRPNQTEVCGNMVDDNCDGRVDYLDALYEDRDNDGRGNREVRMAGTCRPGWVTNDEDCDDARSETFRGAREQCGLPRLAQPVQHERVRCRQNQQQQRRDDASRPS